MINILIVDDHAVVREGLKRIFLSETDMHVSGMAIDAAGALRFMMDTPIDVVVLDISMPGKNGLDIIKDLKLLQPEVRILILSMYPEERFAMRSIRAGASGYLTKEMAPDEIVTAVKKIKSGVNYITPTLANIIATELQHPTDKAPHELLSEREFEVLCLLSSGKPAHEIATTLCISESTVSTYRNRILTKMKLKNNSDLIHYGIVNGLVE
jgi:two-component system, NarL family, invasion response regulator UvrY